jgi:4-diphosphocytidyl-2-C-methyl-D-erythritol kinase
LVIFPNCKINLGLQILGKRADGFHDLESVFYPLPINDALEVIEATVNDPFSFSSSGISMDVDPADNIVTKAWNLLKEDHPEIPDIKIHLHKNIPSGAGLGGGSADGAFMLMLLNKKYKLALSTDQLLDYAAMLGSDCPFFILNKPCFVQGRGEILQSISLDLSTFSFVLIHPGIHISTAWAFSQINPGKSKNMIDIIRQPPVSWKDQLVNDFEKPVFQQYPQIKKIRDDLYSKGALYASMSGSGSAVYGIFEKSFIPEFDYPSEYFIKTIQ